LAFQAELFQLLHLMNSGEIYRGLYLVEAYNIYAT